MAEDLIKQEILSLRQSESDWDYLVDCALANGQDAGLRRGLVVDVAAGTLRFTRVPATETLPAGWVDLPAAVVRRENREGDGSGRAATESGTDATVGAEKAAARAALLAWSDLLAVILGCVVEHDDRQLRRCERCGKPTHRVLMLIDSLRCRDCETGEAFP